VFRASALEFGFAPQTEISMNPETLLAEAFDLVVQQLAASTDGEQVLDSLVQQMVRLQSTKSTFIWNPYRRLRENVIDLYTVLTAHANTLQPIPDAAPAIAEIAKNVLGLFAQYRTIVEQSELEPAKWFLDLTQAPGHPLPEELYDATFAREAIKKPPRRTSMESYNRTLELLTPLQQQIRNCSAQYYELHALTYYRPYVEMHHLLKSTIEKLKRREGRIFIGDIGKKLSNFVQADTVPEIYFNLGESVTHYLIDEFQDTSPIQWANLRPLFENAVSGTGSLFVVGDTKQSIFSFRGADWRILKRLMEEQEFPSVATTVRSLGTNFRSAGRIMQFNEEVFHRCIPAAGEEGAAAASGLSTYQQLPAEGAADGYVEVDSFPPDAEPAAEKTKLLSIIAECHARGYRYSDIAVLTPKNSDVVSVSSWLNEAGLAFISHSSLDVRTRSITGELIALLRFLDSPVDDCSFATVLLGKCLGANLQAPVTTNELRQFLLRTQSRPRRAPIYTEFRTAYPALWERYFADLFRLAGYLPMYDLAAAILKVFHLFDLMNEEEGTLVKFLEVIRDFEENGQNSIKDFIAFADDESDDSTWTINIPSDIDAVSVMTIHKAKGLGFPVCLVLLYDTRGVSDNRILDDADENLRLFHITQSSAKHSDKLKKLLSDHHVRLRVDELNKLYVALTRAKEELYVLSIQRDRIDRPSVYLPRSGYEPAAKPSAHIAPVPEYHSAATIHAPSAVLPQPAAPGQLNWNERRRGDWMHAVLSKIEYLEADLKAHVHRCIAEAAKEFSAPIPMDRAAAERTLLRFLSLPDVHTWYESRPGRRVMNEQEFVRADGRLFRMDRVILDDDTATILDFKTGEEKDAYQEQMDGYIHILRDIYPERTVHAMLAYIDAYALKSIV
jgi:ATP-dependent exoDNAse (exonuclease V) beta subunit